VHELSVTENLLEITLRHARQANAVRVSDIYIVVGQLSSIVGDSVQFYWDMISAGTIAEKSKLHFERREAELACMNCGERFKIQTDSFLCPRCNLNQVRVISGNEFYLESILVENKVESNDQN
jgi:hydrogenase nickel incorporation protein HypA/HybF